MQQRPAQIARKGIAIQPRVGVFAGADAGGGCADDDGDALGAVAVAQRGQSVQNSVLLQRQPCESVVTAVERRQCGRQRQVFHAIDAADPRVQTRIGRGAIAEVVATQTAAARAQRIRLRFAAVTQRSGGGVGADRDRRHLRKRHRCGGHRVALDRKQARIIAIRPESR